MQLLPKQVLEDTTYYMYLLEQKYYWFFEKECGRFVLLSRYV